jgi:hypothetical protein
MYWQNVRVLEPGDELDLALEALRTEGGGDLGVEDLERDRAVVPQIMGEVDDSHPTTSELALDAVAVGQDGLETIGGCVGQLKVLPEIS